jgi:hypothetical protein
MWELTTITIAFLAVSAGVITLARSTTARWERERTAARVRRRAAAARRAGRPTRLGRARAGAARRMRSARRVGTALGHTLAGHGHRTRAEGASTDDSELGPVVLPAPQPPPRERPRRRVLRGVLARPGQGSAIPRRQRRAARGLHPEGTERAPDEPPGPAG